MLSSIFIFGILTMVLLYTLRRKLNNQWKGILALLLPLYILCIAVYNLMYDSQLMETVRWIPELDVNFVLIADELNGYLMLLISILSSLVLLYAVFYMSHFKNVSYFFIFMVFFILSMIGIVISDNLMTLYLFWEMTSVSSFLLISYKYYSKDALKGALTAFLITVTGGSIMLLGFIILYNISGTFSIRTLIEQQSSLNNHQLYPIALLLILAGVFTKSAQFPFHSWLPGAMAAPTPVSSLLHSATMVKAGLFLLVKMTPLFMLNHQIALFIFITGIVTFTYGGIKSIGMDDLKRVLAFSTISQLGMMVTLYGVILLTEGTLQKIAISALIFHITAHAFFKATLFMSTGIIDHAFHTRKLSRLNKIHISMPVTFATITISALSMAGVPLFSGFLTKEMLLTLLYEMSLLHSGYLAGLLFVFIGSLASFIYSVTLIYRLMKQDDSQLNQAEKNTENMNKGIVIPSVILAVLTILLFFMPNIVTNLFVNPIANQLLNSEGKHISWWHGMNIPFVMTLAIIILGTLAVLFKGYKRMLFTDKDDVEVLYRGLGQTVMNRLTYSFKFLVNEKIQFQIMYVYLFVIIIILPLLIRHISALTIHIEKLNIFLIIVGIIMILAAVMILKVESRMTAVVLTGVIGYGVSLCYIYLKAPDLALTQLVIETITTVLFLACFYHLPNLENKKLRIRERISSHLIAFLMAAIVFIILMMSADISVFNTISEYYNDSYEKAGAKNIVNAILGDFRAFDTLLEGIVILIAGLGIRTILRKEVKHERK